MAGSGTLRADTIAGELPPAVRAGAELAAGLLLATAVVMLAPVLLSRLLTIEAIAAIDAAWLEGLFVSAVFGLLALVAWAALRASGRQVGWGGLPFPGAALGLVVGVAGVALALLLSALAGTLEGGRMRGSALPPCLAGAWRS